MAPKISPVERNLLPEKEFVGWMLRSDPVHSPWSCGARAAWHALDLSENGMSGCCELGEQLIGFVVIGKKISDMTSTKII